MHNPHYIPSVWKLVGNYWMKEGIIEQTKYIDTDVSTLQSVSDPTPG